ncbi:MAG: glutamyl-tRNA reductase [Spirochaetes bacterium]|nr:glutamyl-tRNA reductase [Spirochaetota bacterium]
MMTKRHRERRNIPEFILLGISHKSAPVEIRERFALTAEEQPAFFEKAREAGIEEMVYISTCNRVSIYFTALHPDEALDRCIGLLEAHSGMARSEFEPYLYRKFSGEAVTHLFTVTSSLDSMVIGENEILSQVKAAYRTAVQCTNTGMLMNRLFHQAFSTAKRVKTETDISQNPLSIAYIATEQAVSVLGDLADRRALLIGAGEMGELIVKYLSKQKIGGVTIANRSLHNAERIIKDFNIKANVVTLNDIVENACESDIIITSVTCQDYLVTRPMADKIMKRRHGRALFMIDIAVPRNIEPASREVNGVHLFDIDDLKMIAQANMKNRLNEVDLARQIIAADTGEFMKWYDELEVVPLITKMRRSFNEVRKKELEKYRRRKLKHLSEEDFRILDEMTHQIMTKTLHNPIMAIKRYQASKSSGHVDIETIVDELFKSIK